MALQGPLYALSIVAFLFLIPSASANFFCPASPEPCPSCCAQPYARQIGADKPFFECKTSRSGSCAETAGDCKSLCTTKSESASHYLFLPSRSCSCYSRCTTGLSTKSSSPSTPSTAGLGIAGSISNCFSDCQSPVTALGPGLLPTCCRNPDLNLNGTVSSSQTGDNSTASVDSCIGFCKKSKAKYYDFVSDADAYGPAYSPYRCRCFKSIPTGTLQPSQTDQVCLDLCPPQAYPSIFPSIACAPGSSSNKCCGCGPYCPPGSRVCPRGPIRLCPAVSVCQSKWSSSTAVSYAGSISACA